MNIKDLIPFPPPTWRVKYDFTDGMYSIHSHESAIIFQSESDDDGGGG